MERKPHITRDAKHEFALYVASLHQFNFLPEQQLTLDDPVLVHRMAHILRLSPTDQLILFNAQVHARVRIDVIHKKQIIVSVCTRQSRVDIPRKVTLWLPVLKREALEQAVDTATQMGVTSIELFYCAKSRQQLQEKDLQRLQKIIIAACEQAKQFAIPELHAPVALTQRIQQYKPSTHTYFFDPAGLSARVVADQLQNDAQAVLLIVGPEGDLIGAEKDMLRAAQVQFIALTPTVLRAEQAAALAIGLVRCL